MFFEGRQLPKVENHCFTANVSKWRLMLFLSLDRVATNNTLDSYNTIEYLFRKELLITFIKKCCFCLM